jgi:hypothetical protein
MHFHAMQAAPLTMGTMTVDACLEVYAISDLHCDYPSNMDWVERMVAQRVEEKEAASKKEATPRVLPVLIVAGDCSDSLVTLE